ncbi:MAG TPA: hypothetical protein PK095_11120, partial [Myxococcota bacterium]|nr:hypothetical protein [Myxococcota bacterium]
MPRTPVNALLDAMRSAYGPADSVDDWLARLTAETEGLFESGMGSIGRVLAMKPELKAHRYQVSVRNDALRAALSTHEARSARRMDFLLAGGPGLRSTREAIATRWPEDPYFAEMIARFAEVGMADMLHLTAYDGDGAWVTLGFPLPYVEREARRSPCWTRAAIHLATALRLQKRALDLARRLPEDAAVLAPDGRLVHAQGLATGARAHDRLRSAVRAIDRSRTDKTSETRAFEVWLGLVDGTWSLVDRHDSDGRRYLLAVRNEVPAQYPQKLSSREAEVAAFAAEGYSDKWIAYTLGIER